MSPTVTATAGTAEQKETTMNSTTAADIAHDLMLVELDEDAAWMDDALCAQTDPEAFFPDKGGSTRAAKAVCAACPVRQQCLDYALAHRETSGIWGGLSALERRALLKGDLQIDEHDTDAQKGTAA